MVVRAARLNAPVPRSDVVCLSESIRGAVQTGGIPDRGADALRPLLGNGRRGFPLPCSDPFRRFADRTRPRTFRPQHCGMGNRVGEEQEERLLGLIEKSFRPRFGFLRRCVGGLNHGDGPHHSRIGAEARRLPARGLEPTNLQSLRQSPRRTRSIFSTEAS